MRKQKYKETINRLNRSLRSIVHDTTKNRAPEFYQAPDLSSENPEKDYEEGMRLIGSIDRRYCFSYFEDWPKGKRFLLKAAHNGHVRAQFVLGCMYRIGINVCPDFVMAEIWLQEAIQNGLSGDDLAKAKIELLQAQQQREWRWFRI